MFSIWIIENIDNQFHLFLYCSQEKRSFYIIAWTYPVIERGQQSNAGQLKFSNHNWNWCGRKTSIFIFTYKTWSSPIPVLLKATCYSESLHLALPVHTIYIFYSLAFQLVSFWTSISFIQQKSLYSSGNSATDMNCRYLIRVPMWLVSKKDITGFPNVPFLFKPFLLFDFTCGTAPSLQLRSWTSAEAGKRRRAFMAMHPDSSWTIVSNQLSLQQIYLMIHACLKIGLFAKTEACIKKQFVHPFHGKVLLLCATKCLKISSGSSLEFLLPENSLPRASQRWKISKPFCFFLIFQVVSRDFNP